MKNKKIKERRKAKVVPQTRQAALVVQILARTRRKMEKRTQG